MTINKIRCRVAKNKNKLMGNIDLSFGAGILFRDALDGIHLGGYPLGFWFAQQGSIYVFVGLIFWYARRMGKIDREHDVHED